MPHSSHLAFLIGVKDYQHLQPLKTPRTTSEIWGNCCIQAKDILLFFINHGIIADSETGVKGYLMPADAQRTTANTWLLKSEMLQALFGMPCRHNLVLHDCCFSGSLLRASKHRYANGLADTEDTLYKNHYEHFQIRRSS